MTTPQESSPKEEIPQEAPPMESTPLEATPLEATPLESIAGDLLRQRGLRLAIAESCTGGLIGHTITNVPGSSTYYMGSVTAYAYDAKVRLLGVTWETLELHGAVSQETVLEMARGVRNLLAADVGLAVSGIAGPGGGTRDKPVGLVWIGLSMDNHQKAWRYVFEGDRLAVKEQSARQALQHLADTLHLVEKKHLAEKVEVTAIFDKEGSLQPLSFTWNERRFEVSASGRRWEDELGKHVLVMDHADRVYELIFVPTESCWYLSQPGKRRRTV